MIYVTSLNGENRLYINYDKIELVETTPDTMISLESGRKYLVAEDAETIVKFIEDAKRRVHSFVADL